MMYAKSELIDAPCWMDGCSPDHRVRNCPKFKALSREEKEETIVNMRACVFCSRRYIVEECPTKQYWQSCDRNGCKRYHTGCTTPGHNLHIVSNESCIQSKKDDKSQNSVILIIEDIKLTSGNHAKVFWDSGSTMALIRNEFAKSEGLMSIPVTYALTTVAKWPRHLKSIRFFKNL